MGKELKAWQIGGIIGGGFFLFWFGIIAQVFQEGGAIDIITGFTLYLIAYTFGWFFYYLKLPMEFYNYYIFGLLLYILIGGMVGYFIGAFLKGKR